MSEPLSNESPWRDLTPEQRARMLYDATDTLKSHVAKDCLNAPERAEVAEREADELTTRLETRLDDDSVYRVYNAMQERALVAEARAQRYGEALAELLRWQPHLEVGLAHLHPQHRQAIEQARAFFKEPPA